MAIYKSKTPTKDGRSYYFMLYKKDNIGVNKKYMSKKYKTKQEARDAEAEFILKRDNPSHVKLKIIAADFFNYLSTIKRESTIYTYKKDYNNHIATYFNEMDILDINISNIRNWAESMNKKNL
ncbi:MAG: Arm DNA-binding domain-containing protein, partial [Bacillota bacterium]|nr:Arm DNA-binding domain-containing protein [Bacillota bacterium]